MTINAHLLCLLREIEHRGGPVSVMQPCLELYVSIGSERIVLTSLERVDEAILIVALRDDAGPAYLWPGPGPQQLLATLEMYLELILWHAAV